jgi:hypothetical protein
VRNWRANISYIHSCLEASTDHLGIRIARVSRAVSCSARAPRCSLSCAACHPPSASIVPQLRVQSTTTITHHPPSPSLPLTSAARDPSQLRDNNPMNVRSGKVLIRDLVLDFPASGFPDSSRFLLFYFLFLSLSFRGL